MNIPYYRDTGRRIELDDPGLYRGLHAGSVQGIRLTPDGLRLSIQRTNGGWVDGVRTCEISYHEVPDDVDEVRLPANIAARFDAGTETDADVIALVDAYRLSRTIPDVEIHDDPMYASVGGGR